MDVVELQVDDVLDPLVVRVELAAIGRLPVIAIAVTGSVADAREVFAVSAN